MRITERNGKHTISLMTDEDLATLYRHLPVNHTIRNQIRKHLIECVTDEQLEDSGVDNPDDYITNWLGGEWEETRAVITNPITPIMSQIQIPGEE